MGVFTIFYNNPEINCFWNIEKKIALPDRSNGGLFSSIEDYNGPFVAADIVTEALTVHLEAVLERENSRKRRSTRSALRSGSYNLPEMKHVGMKVPDWLVEPDVDVDKMDFLLSPSN